MDETNRRQPLSKKLVVMSIIKLLFGGALGAIAYIVVAQMVIDQTEVNCSTGYIRALVEGSTFLASVLLESRMLTTSPHYQPSVLLLSSLPFAILGALTAVRVHKIALLVTLLLTILYLCFFGVVWAFIMAAICA